MSRKNTICLKIIGWLFASVSLPTGGYLLYEHQKAKKEDKKEDTSITEEKKSSNTPLPATNEDNSTQNKGKESNTITHNIDSKNVQNTKKNSSLNRENTSSTTTSTGREEPKAGNQGNNTLVGVGTQLMKENKGFIIMGIGLVVVAKEQW